MPWPYPDKYSFSSQPTRGQNAYSQTRQQMMRPNTPTLPELQAGIGASAPQYRNGGDSFNVQRRAAVLGAEPSSSRPFANPSVGLRPPTNNMNVQPRPFFDINRANTGFKALDADKSGDQPIAQIQGNAQSQARVDPAQPSQERQSLGIEFNDVDKQRILGDFAGEKVDPYSKARQEFQQKGLGGKILAGLGGALQGFAQGGVGGILAGGIGGATGQNYIRQHGGEYARERASKRQAAIDELGARDKFSEAARNEQQQRYNLAKEAQDRDEYNNNAGQRELTGLKTQAEIEDRKAQTEQRNYNLLHPQEAQEKAAHLKMLDRYEQARIKGDINPVEELDRELNMQNWHHRDKPERYTLQDEFGGVYQGDRSNQNAGLSRVAVAGDPNGVLRQDASRHGAARTSITIQNQNPVSNELSKHTDEIARSEVLGMMNDQERNNYEWVHEGKLPPRLEQEYLKRQNYYRQAFLEKSYPGSSGKVQSYDQNQKPGFFKSLNSKNLPAATPNKQSSDMDYLNDE